MSSLVIDIHAGKELYLIFDNFCICPLDVKLSCKFKTGQQRLMSSIANAFIFVQKGFFFILFKTIDPALVFSLYMYV